jgi:transcriptional regulator with GAF, ATPase, and Fis domain
MRWLRSTFLSVAQGIGKAGRASWSTARRLILDPVFRRHLSIVLAAFLVCAYAGGVLSYVATTPEIGLRCAFAPVVNHFYPEFLYPEELRQERLKPGDTLRRIGHQEIETWPQLLRTEVELTRQQGEEMDPRALAALIKAGKGPEVAVLRPDGQKVFRVEARRLGETLVVWCRMGPPPTLTLIPSLLWFFLKIGLFAVGAIVFWKRPEEPYAGHFFLLCIVSLGAYIGGYHWAQILTQPALLLVFMVSSVFLPPVSLHFYLIFPRPKKFMAGTPWGVLLALYGPPLFFLLQLLLGYVSVRSLYASGPSAEAQIALRMRLLEILSWIYIYFGLAALYYLASVVSLVHSYRAAADVVERNQVKWILSGYAAALAPIGYSFYMAFAEQGRFAGGGAVWPMFAASVCVTGAYTISITRYRLMQLDKLISSGMVYFLFSSLAGLIYCGLLFAGVLLVGSQFGDGPSLGQALTVSSTALLLLLLLDLVRGKLKSALDRHYRREKHQLDHTLQRMRLAIEQLVDPPTLARRLLQTAADLLGVARGAVYLRQGQPALYQLADALGPPPTVADVPAGAPLVEALAQQGSLWLRPRPGSGDAAHQQLQQLGGQVGTALVHEGQLLGFLVLGTRDGGPYTPEDLNLLTAFARLTVLALVSAEGHRTIQNLNRELQTKVEKIAEQQRRILVLQSQLMSSSNKEEARKGSPEPALADQNQSPKADPSADASPVVPDGLVGSSPRIRDLLHLVRKVAASQSAVLLRGESGTGKEILALALHENSPRAAGPFIKVHCAALSAGLLESELFGHVKGAFTNAIRDKMGRFEAAHGGTLFLDEIGDISLEVQTKLLRVLQEMTFERVGSSEPIQVDVRIVAATHQDLEELMRQGRFREDLFYRLNVFPIVVPPLRERIEDVPELAMYFLKLYGQRAGKDISGIDDDALAVLKGFSWPGNIRQLENVIERAVVIAEGPVITLDELAPDLLGEQSAAQAPTRPWLGLPPDGSNGAGLPLPDLATLVQSERAEKERQEREQVLRALAAAGGNKAEAARALGMARSTLLSRLKRLGVG